jgi:hypothetical protein
MLIIWFMKFTHTTLRITRAPYTFSILLFSYLSSGRHKNAEFSVKIVVTEMLNRQAERLKIVFELCCFYFSKTSWLVTHKKHSWIWLFCKMVFIYCKSILNWTQSKSELILKIKNCFLSKWFLETEPYSSISFDLVYESCTQCQILLLLHLRWKSHRNWISLS